MKAGVDRVPAAAAVNRDRLLDHLLRVIDARARTSRISSGEMCPEHLDRDSFLTHDLDREAA